MTKSPRYINNKTGGIYQKLSEVLDATNGRDGYLVIYRHIDTGKTFAREKNEFYLKFTIHIDDV